MTCGTSTPAKHESEMDRGLAVYRDSHRAVARYSVILKETVFEKAPFKVIQTDLDYETAIAEEDRLNKTLAFRGFTSPVYSVKLQNPEEAKAAVAVAATNTGKKRLNWRDQPGDNRKPPETLLDIAGQSVVTTLATI